MNHRLTRTLAWAWVALAAAIFVVRGPMRALVSGHKSNDLAPSYAAAKAWMQGRDPYSHVVLQDILSREGRELSSKGDTEVSTSLYPPPTYLALLPLAFLSWPLARIAYLIANLVLFGFLVRSLLRLGGLDARETAGLLLIGSVLALAPYHTGIALGQFAIPCVALLVIAIDRMERTNGIAGGIPLAVAALLKPQIAAPFVLWLLLRRRFRPAMVALGVCLAATLVSVGWLELHHVHWMEGLIANTKLEWVGGGIDTQGELAYQLIDARLAFTALGLYPAEIPTIVVGAFVGVALFWWGHKLGDDDQLLYLSTIAVWTLLITYHRFYDAVLLCLPLVWTIREYRRHPRQRIAFGAFACCAVFFLPGQVALERLAEGRGWPASVTRSFAWDSIALKHQAWTLIVLLALLLAALREAVRSNPKPVASIA